MKRRNFIYLGVTAVLAGSILSCGAAELNPSNYTEITEEEAQEIISNFDAQTSFEEIETMVLKAEGIGITGVVTSGSASLTTQEFEEGYYVDFRDESLYIYGYISSVYLNEAFLITGSGDSYKYQYSSDGQITTDQELTFEEAKAQHSTYWSYLRSIVIFDEDFIYQLNDYGYETDITYSTYGDYIMLTTSLDGDYSILDTLYSISGTSYVMYNGKGLLRYGKSDTTISVYGSTASASSTYDAEYNVSLSKKTSL